MNEQHPIQPYRYSVQFWQEVIPLLMAIGMALYGIGQALQMAREFLGRS